jgi:hypothetical protein
VMRPAPARDDHGDADADDGDDDAGGDGGN